MSDLGVLSELPIFENHKKRGQSNLSLPAISFCMDLATRLEFKFSLENLSPHRLQVGKGGSAPAF